MDDKTILARLTADVVTSYVGNRSLSEGELDHAIERLPALIASVHEALANIVISTPVMSGEQPVHEHLAEAPTDRPDPTVLVEQTVHDDYIVCLEDGQRFKTLKRHLAAHHGMTPEAYREKWNLPDDYPMAASSYGEARAAIAKRIGLGVGGRGSRPAHLKRPARKRSAPRTRGSGKGA